MSADYEWRNSARCSGTDTDIFYPPRDRNLYTSIANSAKKFCYGENGKSPCPVRRECLWAAVSSDEPHGIWGGLSHRERNALVRVWRRKFKATLTLQEFIMTIEDK